MASVISFGDKKGRKRKSRMVDGIQKAFGASKYSDALVFAAYDAAKSGMSERKIAEFVGVNNDDYRRWKQKHPLFRLAIEKGMEFHRKADGAAVTLKDYVYRHLDPALQRLWKEINQPKTTVARLDQIFDRAGIRARQQLYLHALTVSNFNASQALKKLGLAYSTVQQWAERDPEFGRLMQEMDTHKGNFFESALVGAVKGGDVGAILFANRTFNKNRGYGIKVEHEVSGTVNHLHATVDIEMLDLDLDTRRKILEAIQKQEENKPKMLGYEPKGYEQSIEEAIDVDFEEKEAG